MEKHELETTLLEVMQIHRYRGCYVTKINGGWEVFGVKCSTPEEVDQTIDKAGSILSESITVVNKKDGSMETTQMQPNEQKQPKFPLSTKNQYNVPKEK